MAATVTGEIARLAFSAASGAQNLNALLNVARVRFDHPEVAEHAKSVVNDLEHALRLAQELQHRIEEK